MVAVHDQKKVGDPNERADRTIVNMLWLGGIASLITEVRGVVEGGTEMEMKGVETEIDEGIDTAMVLVTARKTRSENETGTESGTGTGTDTDGVTRIVTGIARKQGAKSAAPVRLLPVMTVTCQYDRTRDIAMVILVLKNYLGNGDARLMMMYAIFFDLVASSRNSYNYPSLNALPSGVHAKIRTVMSVIDDRPKKTSVNATRNTNGKNEKVIIVLLSQIRLARQLDFIFRLLTPFTTACW